MTWEQEAHEGCVHEAAILRVVGGDLPGPGLPAAQLQGGQHILGQEVT